MTFGAFARFIDWIKRLLSAFRKKGPKLEEKVKMITQPIEGSPATKNFRQEEVIVQKETTGSEEVEVNKLYEERLLRKDENVRKRSIKWKVKGKRVEGNRKRKIKIIDLGRRARTGNRTTSLPEEKQTIRKKMSPGVSDRITAPFIELDTNEARVFLVIPKQEFSAERISGGHLKYKIKMSDNSVKTDAIGLARKDKRWEIAEQKIEIERPLQSLEVVFPLKAGERVYRYDHRDDSLYVFAERGERGRMYYLYDLEGGANYLPRKEVWILLREDFELDSEPNLIGEMRVWEYYRMLRIDLKNAEELVLTSRKNTGKRKVISCKPDFSLYGEKVVYDDFGEQFPIFTSMPIEVVAPVENEEGWSVRLRSERANFAITVSEEWSGREPLKIDLGRNGLPCECGEFELEICDRDGKNVATLFFRYIPSLELRYPRKLIVPISGEGHGVEEIEVLLADAESWEVKAPQQVKITQNGYRIVLPPDEDVLKFSISKKGKSETETKIKITLPRLRWKISKQNSWTDKPIYLTREELISGGDLSLVVNPNGFTDYDFRVTLEAKDRQLQEAMLSREGDKYVVRLNQFFDSIMENKGKLALKLMTPFPEGGKIDVIYFLPDVNSLKEVINLLKSLGYVYAIGDALETDYERVEEILREKVEELRDLCTYISGKLSNTELNELLKEAQKERDQNDLIDEAKCYVKILGIFKDEMKKEIDELRDKVKGIKEIKKAINENLIKQLEDYFKELEKIYFVKPLQKRNVEEFYEGSGRISEYIEFIKYRMDKFWDSFTLDVLNPGRMTYLVEKWRYFKEKDGRLSSKMIDDDFDEKYVLGPLKEYVSNLLKFKQLEEDKVRKGILEFYVPKSLAGINLDYRLEHIDFLSVEDKKFAKLDAEKFFGKLLKIKKEIQRGITVVGNGPSKSD